MKNKIKKIFSTKTPKTLYSVIRKCDLNINPEEDEIKRIIAYAYYLGSCETAKKAAEMVKEKYGDKLYIDYYDQKFVNHCKTKKTYINLDVLDSLITKHV